MPPSAASPTFSGGFEKESNDPGRANSSTTPFDDEEK
jgi:hypothetical protein